MFLIFLWVGRPPDAHRWETEDIAIYGVLLLVLTVIPIQLRHYFRPPNKVPNDNHGNA
jgi:hypothetical protein